MAIHQFSAQHSKKTIFEVVVRDINIVDPVQTCFENTSIAKALQMMQQSRIGNIVIVKDLKPIGIFTERDFLFKLAGKTLKLEETQISTYMTPNPVCMSMDDNLYKVITRMRSGRFRNVIIVDSGGLVRKVLSLQEIMNFITDWLSVRAPQSAKMP
jgi:CBS domain-containing protein